MSTSHDLTCNEGNKKKDVKNSSLYLSCKLWPQSMPIVNSFLALPDFAKDKTAKIKSILLY